MSSPPWYMHPPSRISLPKNVHKSNILPGILSTILSPFLTRIDKWAKKNEENK